MRKICIIALAAILLQYPSIAAAWFDMGHMTVAVRAENLVRIDRGANSVILSL